MKRNSILILATAVLSLSVVAADVVAQPQGQRPQGQRPGGQGGFGQRGSNPIQLLRVAEVREEVELLDEQYEELQTKARKIQEAARGTGERPNFRELSEEERNKLIAEFRKRSEETNKKIAKLVEDVLLPHQKERLDQIALQMQGTAALFTPKVREALKITAETGEKMQHVSREVMEGVRDKAREAFQSGNRDGIRELFENAQKEVNEKVLGLLSDSQKKNFEEMKGKPFKLPEGALRRPGGGQGGQRPGGQGGQRPGGQGGERPARPAT